MTEKIKDVEKMIAKVMKKKDIGRNAAIDYMLIVATGRLAALWRYDDTLPEGKATKGVFDLRARKKPAPKTPKIAPPAERPIRAAREADDLAAAKKRPKRKVKSKPKAEQIEIAAAE